MAPTSKPTPGNPAPDFTVNMNRIQTQLEARLRAARSFLPSRSSLTSANTGSFSALHSSSNTPKSHSQSRDESAVARRQAEEAEFAEERGLDPNAGIGTNRRTAPESDASGRDRDTARLRGRLLGKRGRGGGGAEEQRWRRRDDSSDEEEGRGGLGRVRNGKRSRVEVEDGAEGDPHELENSDVKPTEVDESNQPDMGESSKKKRKRKKKKPKTKPEDSLDVPETDS